MLTYFIDMNSNENNILKTIPSSAVETSVYEDTATPSIIVQTSWISHQCKDYRRIHRVPISKTFLKTQSGIFLNLDKNQDNDN